MKNTFEVGGIYSAAQNISRLALANGHVPLFYQGLVYTGFEVEEGTDNILHNFAYEGEIRSFDDDFINNGRAEDNGIVIG